jgi:non-ribosomal peptide synthetase component F
MLKKLTTAVVWPVLALVRGVVGLAHADTADDQFVAALSSHGIPGDRDALIAIAHQFCDAQDLPRIGIGLPSPYTMQILNLRNQLVGQGLSQRQMDQLAHDAVAAYCPDRMH